MTPLPEKVQKELDDRADWIALHVHQHAQSQVAHNICDLAAEAYRLGVEQERQACAAIARGKAEKRSSGYHDRRIALEIAEAIEARGKDAKQ